MAKGTMKLRFHYVSSYSRGCTRLGRPVFSPSEPQGINTLHYFKPTDFFV